MDKQEYVRCPNCSFVYSADLDKCPKCGGNTQIDESTNTEPVFNLND